MPINEFTPDNKLMRQEPLLSSFYRRENRSTDSSRGRETAGCPHLHCAASACRHVPCLFPLQIFLDLGENTDLLYSIYRRLHYLLFGELFFFLIEAFSGKTPILRVLGAPNSLIRGEQRNLSHPPCGSHDALCAQSQSPIGGLQQTVTAVNTMLWGPLFDLVKEYSTFGRFENIVQAQHLTLELCLKNQQSNKMFCCPGAH